VVCLQGYYGEFVLADFVSDDPQNLPDVRVRNHTPREEQDINIECGLAHNMGFGTWLKQKFLRFLGFQKVESVSISASLLEDLCEMARDAHPKEMIAFLSASKGIRKGRLHIDEIQLQAYNASTHSAQVMLHQLPTFTTIVGTVHSHPGGSRRPSSADRNFWSHYGYVHAIIGEPYTPRHVTYYSKDANVIVVAISD